MSFQDKYAIGLGTLNSCKFNVDSSNGFGNINANVDIQMLPGDSSLSTPILYPYGFISMPINGTISVTANISGNPFSPLVLGTIPNNSNLFATSLMIYPGESAMYGPNYSLVNRLTGLYATLNNAAGEQACTMLYGENIVKILIDIINQIDVLCAAAMITPNPSMATDLAALEAGQCYVNDTGALVV